MKQKFFLGMAILFTLGVASCSKDNGTSENSDGPETPKAKPTIEWPTNAEFAPMAIEDDMTGKAVILVKAEEGIRDFKLNIESGVLTNEILTGIGLSTNIDLINNANASSILKEMGVPAGSELKDAQEVSFDISALVPLIVELAPTQSGTHTFNLSVTDNADNTLSKAITFTYTFKQIAIADIDLWNNTATVNTTGFAADAKVQYRLQGETDWNDAILKAENKYTIGTAWSEEKNDADLTIYTVNPKLGVFAGHTYEYRLMEGDTQAATGSFDTKSGDIIPNGDMANWSTKAMGKNQVQFPNKEGEAFWDSGNNSYTLKNPLCSEGADTDAQTASLQAVNAVIVFAAGNMFTGTFSQSGVKGDAEFGASYTYTARPTALKLRYKATVDICNKAGSKDPLKDEYLNKKTDEGRIFVAITDWTARHKVTSGLGVDPTTTLWDPTKQKDTAEGNILAYGSIIIKESSDGWVELSLPLSWYIKEAAMPTKEYALVIACSTSCRGDYLTGSTNNRLSVDDFAWVY